MWVSDVHLHFCDLYVVCVLVNDWALPCVPCSVSHLMFACEGLIWGAHVRVTKCKNNNSSTSYKVAVQYAKVSPSVCPSTFTQIYHEYSHGASCVTLAPLIECVNLPSPASHSIDQCVCLVSSTLIVYGVLALQGSYICAFVITNPLASTPLM